MRKISQFKILLKTRDYYRSFPAKILTFKHSKWAFIRQKLIKKVREEKKQKKQRKWYEKIKKLKKYNKKKLNKRKFLNLKKIPFFAKKFHWKISPFRAKRKINFILGQLYDQSVNKKELVGFLKKKNNLNRLIVFKRLFVRLEYRLDIFLSRLNFFNNIYECRAALSQGEILVNGENLGNNTFLKKGDIIQVSSIFHIKKIIYNKKSLPYFNSFIEIDFYTGLIVILKDIQELNSNDLTLFVPKWLSVDKAYASLLK